MSLPEFDSKIPINKVNQIFYVTLHSTKVAFNPMDISTRCQSHTARSRRPRQTRNTHPFLISPYPPYHPLSAIPHPGRCCTVNPVILIFRFRFLISTTCFFHLNGGSPTCFGELDFRKVVVGLRVYLFVIVLSSTLMGQYSDMNNRSHLFSQARRPGIPLLLRCL